MKITTVVIALKQAHRLYQMQKETRRRERRGDTGN